MPTLTLKFNRKEHLNEKGQEQEHSHNPFMNPEAREIVEAIREKREYVEQLRQEIAALTFRQDAEALLKKISLYNLARQSEPVETVRL